MIIVYFILIVILLAYVGYSLGYLMLSENMPYLKNTKLLCWHIPIITLMCMIYCFKSILKDYGLIYAIKSLFVNSKMIIVGCVIAKVIYDYLEQHKKISARRVQMEFKLIPVSKFKHLYQERVTTKLRCA